MKGESDDDFLERLREEARYCDFEKLKTAANPAEQLTKLWFISGLWDLEAKLRLLDGIKAKPAILVTEMTESLPFRSQAMAFASSSSCNKPFTVNEEKMSPTSKRPFENQMKNLQLIKATTCAQGVEVSQTLVDPVQR